MSPSPDSRVVEKISSSDLDLLFRRPSFSWLYYIFSSSSGIRRWIAVSFLSTSSRGRRWSFPMNLFSHAFLCIDSIIEVGKIYSESSAANLASESFSDRLFS